MTCSTSRAEFVAGDLKHSNVFTLFCLDWNAGFIVCRTHHHVSGILQGENRASTSPVASQHAKPLTYTWLGDRSVTCSISSMTRFCSVCWEVSCLSWVTCVMTVRRCPCGLQAEKNIPHKWNAEGCDTSLLSLHCVVQRTGGYLLRLRLTCMFCVVLISLCWKIAAKHLPFQFFSVFYSCFDLIWMPRHLIL